MDDSRSDGIGTEQTLEWLRNFVGDDLERDNWTIIIRPEDGAFRALYVPSGFSDSYFVSTPGGSDSLSRHVSRYGKRLKHAYQAVKFVNNVLDTRRRLRTEPKLRKMLEKMHEAQYRAVESMLEQERADE
jgi:hypothetical protein